MRIQSVVALACVLALCGCRELAVPPAGSYSEVLLVTEDGEHDEWAEVLTPLITREHEYFIGQEPGFKVFNVRAEHLEDFPTYKNIVICGTLDTSRDVGRRIAGLIGDAGAKKVQQGSASILKKENLPAPGQLTVIITAADSRGLRSVIDERGGELSDILEASCRERLRAHLMTSPNKQLSAELKRKYGFDLSIPSLYILFSDDGRPPGVELIRETPARVLGVYWVDREEPPSIYEPDELFDIRADYVWRRYNRDKMDPEMVSYTYTRLGPYDAIRMSGYWYKEEEPAGGYYETYFIHDEKDELLWAVDLLVYAPGHPKHAFVRELQALAETFRIN